MVNNIKYFKQEKLKSYYKSMRICSEIHKNNATSVSKLWNCVSEDKNIKSLPVKNEISNQNNNNIGSNK